MLIFKSVLILELNLDIYEQTNQKAVRLQWLSEMKYFRLQATCWKAWKRKIRK